MGYCLCHFEENVFNILMAVFLLSFAYNCSICAALFSWWDEWRTMLANARLVA